MSHSRPRPPLTEQVPPPEFLPQVLQRLRERYAATLPAPRRFPDPLDGVLRVILAQQNTRAIAARQWDMLRATYPVWEAAYADGPDGIESTLRQAGGGLTRTKAAYLWGILDALEQFNDLEPSGELSLRFLHGLDDAEARQVLQSLPGVGQKTASLVLLFDLRRPAMPVDNNIERWIKRLELVPARWNANRIEVWLEHTLAPDWETRYALHISGVRHGHETCKSQRPLCAECVLLEFCPTGGLLQRERQNG